MSSLRQRIMLVTVMPLYVGVEPHNTPNELQATGEDYGK